MKYAWVERYFLIIPGILSVLSLAALFMWGLKPGIDLSGGSLLEVTYTVEAPSADEVREAVTPLAVGEIRVQPAGDKSYILKQRDLTPEEKSALVSLLGELGPLTENRFTSIGPALGAELRQKAWIAIVLVIISIILFITFAFRHVSKPVASWKYGIVTILTLVHDILVPVGLFAVLGHFYGAEVDTLFIVGILTILGLSINDTIVVFDRIRENLRINEKGHHHHTFEETVWKSIIQTLTRSINTSLTVVIVLIALYFFGPEVMKNFSLMLIVGMIVGTYSSILLAAPTLVAWEKWARK